MPTNRPDPPPSPRRPVFKAGVTQQTIWQRLSDEQGLQASVASWKRWVAANLPEEVRRDRVTVLMDDPGSVLS